MICLLTFFGQMIKQLSNISTNDTPYNAQEK